MNEQIAHHYKRNDQRSKQQYIPPDVPASQHRAGHYAGFHPEDTPFLSTTLAQEGDYEIEEDEGFYVTNPHASHTSARRYYVSPEQVYQQGNKRLHVRYVDVPPRRSAQAQLPPSRQRHVHADDSDEPQTQRPRGRRHIHPLLYLGVGMIAMLALWSGLTMLGNWWTNHQNDSEYGRPRTFQTDAVVGHNDSPTTPSHFIAINLYRHVTIIEIPGGDTSKMRVINGPNLFGDGQDLTPVTLQFKDVNGDGKPDMVIRIQDQVLVMINENGGFRPQKAGEQIHL